MIAIDIPHPHATYFGVNNYRVGVEAGEALSKHSLRHWGGKVEWVLGLDLPEAGQLVQSRITGAFEGVRQSLPNLPDECFVRMNGRGMRDRSRKLVSEFLQRHLKDRHILVATATDSSALGALDAVRELRRDRHVVIVGQDCIEEVTGEMLKPNSPLIGSVSHEAGVTARTSSISAWHCCVARRWLPTTTSHTNSSRGTKCDASSCNLEFWAASADCSQIVRRVDVDGVGKPHGGCMFEKLTRARVSCECEQIGNAARRKHAGTPPSLLPLNQRWFLPLRPERSRHADDPG